jgi:hypothetical protein
MRMSQVLNRLADEPGERIAISTIFGALSDRSFAILIVLLGLPNCLPMPPPIPAISALLLMLIAVQVTIGRPAPWIPDALMRKSIKQADLGRAIRRALPIVNRLEALSRPRLHLFDAKTSAILSGLLLFVMAFGMLAAAPLIGQIPYGVAVCLMGLGRAEGDGLLIVSGLVSGVIGAALSASFLYAIFLAVRQMI